jgi:hypothetical protein
MRTNGTVPLVPCYDVSRMTILHVQIPWKFCSLRRPKKELMGSDLRNVVELSTDDSLEESSLDQMFLFSRMVKTTLDALSSTHL